MIVEDSARFGLAASNGHQTDRPCVHECRYVRLAGFGGGLPQALGSFQMNEQALGVRVPHNTRYMTLALCVFEEDNTSRSEVPCLA